jgi:hypothetical protein
MPTPDTRLSFRNLDRRVSAIDQILPTLATKADLERFATKADLERFATKDDLVQFRAQMITLLEAVHTKLDQIIEGFANHKERLTHHAERLDSHDAKLGALDVRVTVLEHARHRTRR